MNVVMTILQVRPVKNRVPPRPVRCHRGPRLPSRSNLKFRVLFRAQSALAHPHKNQPAPEKSTQSTVKERVNKLTNYPINHLTNLPRPPGQPPLGIPWWNFGLVKMALSLHSS